MQIFYVLQRGNAYGCCVALLQKSNQSNPNENAPVNASVYTVTIAIKTMPYAEGETKGFVNNTEASEDDDWDRCEIHLADHSSNYAMQILLVNIHHELGHVLKLSHTFTDFEDPPAEPPLRYYSRNDTPPQEEVISVMNYYFYGNNDISWQTYAPSFLDKVNLILKWGR